MQNIKLIIYLSFVVSAPHVENEDRSDEKQAHHQYWNWTTVEILLIALKHCWYGLTE